VKVSNTGGARQAPVLNSADRKQPRKVELSGSSGQPAKWQQAARAAVAFCATAALAGLFPV